METEIDDAKTYDNAPQEVKDICDSFNEDENEYEECSRIVAELETIGWTAEYYLQGELFNLRKIEAMENTTEIIDSIKNEIEQAEKQEEHRQTKKMLEDSGEIKMWQGNIRYDLPAFDMVYSVTTDNIIKRLNTMEMREEITEEELEYILEETDLN